jgi:hypothetical protein
MSIQAILPASIETEKRKLVPIPQIERWKWWSKAAALRNQAQGKVLLLTTKASS